MKKVGLLSIPFDGNSSFSLGPAKAPEKILDYLKHGSLNKGTEIGIQLSFDDNVEVFPPIIINNQSEFIEKIEGQANKLLSAGYRVLSLGGDHSISFPLLKAYHTHYPDISIVHLDAHSDLYDNFKGNPLSNACPFARIMENQLAKSLHQYGIRTLTPHQIEQANRFRVNVNEMKDWTGTIAQVDGPIYLSIDIDAIDPAFAPGVSHREPGGLSSREVLNIIHQLPNNVVGIDIVEFNPDKDIDDITTNLAAKLVKESIGKLLV